MKQTHPRIFTFFLFERNRIFTCMYLNLDWCDIQVNHEGEELPLPFNSHIFEWANKTREILSSAKLPSGVKFYNIYGTNLATPHSIWYCLYQFFGLYHGYTRNVYQLYLEWSSTCTQVFSIPFNICDPHFTLQIFLSYGNADKPVSDLQELRYLQVDL